jgi:hypothetical protein
MISCGVLYDAVSSFDDGKDLEGSGRGLIEVLSRNLRGEYHVKPQDSRCGGRESNLAPPERQSRAPNLLLFNSGTVIVSFAFPNI